MLPCSMCKTETDSRFCIEPNRFRFGIPTDATQFVTLAVDLGSAHWTLTISTPQASMILATTGAAADLFTCVPTGIATGGVGQEG